MVSQVDTVFRVFLLDDHEVVRKGIATMIDAQPDLEVVGEAESVEQAVEVVAGCSPNVAVLDVRVAGESGIEACRQIRSAHPEVECLMLTSFSDDQAMVDASLAGASGFVLKQVRGDELVTAIRKVASGAHLLDSATVRLAEARLRESGEEAVDSLSPQEQQIFELVGKGMSNRQIAEAMFLSEKTVKNYVSNLLRKLGMDRRAEAAAFSARLDERHQL